MWEKWSERNKCRKEMSAAGGIGLWDTGDFGPVTIHKCTIHKQKNKPFGPFQNAPFGFKV